MAKYLVTLGDGRSLQAFAPNEASAMKQANHQETTRVIIATKRARPVTPPPSTAIAAAKVKD